MILTCPECATSYFVDDARIPAQGRRVKCSSCSHRWLAGPDGPIAEVPAYEPQPEPEPEAVAEEPVDALSEPLDIEPAEPVVVPPPIRRAPASRAKPKADPRSSALVWAGAACVAAALIAGAIVFREQVVRLWPKSSAAYAGLGLAVDGGGLVLEQVRVQPAFLAGRPVLSVTGAIRNVRDVPVEAPPVRLTLLNRAGQPVAAKIARPDDATIPPRAKRHFALTMLDPPATARDLEVRFESGEHAKAGVRQAVTAPQAPAAHPVTATPAAVPAPAEAAPHPATQLSPAALSEHG